MLWHSYVQPFRKVIVSKHVGFEWLWNLFYLLGKFVDLFFFLFWPIHSTVKLVSLIILLSFPLPLTSYATSHVYWYIFSVLMICLVALWLSVCTKMFLYPLVLSNPKSYLMDRSFIERDSLYILIVHIESSTHCLIYAEYITFSHDAKCVTLTCVDHRIYTMCRSSAKMTNQVSYKKCSFSVSEIMRPILT